MASNSTTSVTPAINRLPEVIEKLVDKFRPIRIILFGSWARGDADAASDLDLLVVLPRLENKHESAVAMLKALSGTGVPVDLIPTDPEEIARRGDLVGGVLRPALREGKVVYER